MRREKDLGYRLLLLALVVMTGCAAPAASQPPGGAAGKQASGAFEGGRTLKVNDSLWDDLSSAQRTHVIAHGLMHYADSLRPGFWADYNYFQSRGGPQGGYFNNPYEIFAEHRAAAASGLDPHGNYGSLVNAFGF